MSAAWSGSASLQRSWGWARLDAWAAARPEALWESSDGVWLCIYRGVDRRMDAEACEIVCRERGIQFRADQDDTFHTTITNNPVESAELRQSIFSSCRLARDISCHTVHEG